MASQLELEASTIITDLTENGYLDEHGMITADSPFNEGFEFNIGDGYNAAQHNQLNPIWSISAPLHCGSVHQCAAAGCEPFRASGVYVRSSIA